MVRGRGRGRGKIQRVPPASRSNTAVHGDARDKLIGARRSVTDARYMIRQHVVDKVGDLREVLGPKAPTVGRGRGRGGRDLRVGLSKVHHPKPRLLYDEKVFKNGQMKQNRRDTSIRVSRGGHVTIYRQRGRSMDRQREALERDTEQIQPTGIPVEMRRKPSPPPPRRLERSISPRRVSPTMYRRSPSPLHVRNGQGRSFSRSPSPRGGRLQSYIASPQRRAASPHFRPGEMMPYERDFERRRGGGMRSDYVRPRSRSPLERRRSPSPYMRHAMPPRFQTRHSRSPPPRLRGPFRRSPSPLKMWQQRTPSPVYDVRERNFRSISRSPPPPIRHEHRFESSSREMRNAYRGEGTNQAYQPSLRMDRVPNEAPKLPEKQVAAPNRQRRPPNMDAPVAEIEPQFYTIKVSNLSKEVTQEDVVELFGDIGKLHDAKLIKSGYAEVIFVNKKDAKTAIEKYDRRELDGIPMSLKLIDKPSIR